MSRFRMNPRFLPALAVSPELANAIRQATQAAYDEWYAIAPVLEGHYRDSGRVEILIDNGVVKGRLIAEDEASQYIEFGTIDTPTFAPLRRALSAVFGS